MRIEEEIKLDYEDVLLRPKRSTLNSRKEVNLQRTFRFYHSPLVWTGIPIIASNMQTSGTFQMAEILSTYKIITAFHKFYSIEEYKKFFKIFKNPNYIAYTTGIRDVDLKKIKKMKKLGLMKNFSFICIDVPNGYIKNFLENIKYLRKEFKDHVIIAGNVVTNEIAEEIILQGADIVKVGIGSGAACTTRKMTGVGYPQLSAVIECADAVHGIDNEKACGRVVADGGQRYPSCVAKAFSAGADFNMCGSMFSGFEESGGKTTEEDGKKYKEYFGSSSNYAMENLYGKKENYRSQEGRYTLIPHKGNIKEFLQDLLGSLRSTGTYIGARSLKEFPKRATFIKVNRQLATYLEKYEQLSNKE